MADVVLTTRLQRDADGTKIQTATGFMTKGFEPAEAQIDLFEGAPTSAEQTVTLSINDVDIEWPVEYDGAAVAQTNTITGETTGVEQTVIVKINNTEIDWDVQEIIPAVAQVDEVTGASDGTATSADLAINSTHLSWDIPADIAAVAQVDSITGESDGTEQTVVVNINTTEINWDLPLDVPAVAKVDRIDGTPTADAQTCIVGINTTELEWEIEARVDAVAQVDRIHDTGLEVLIPDVYINSSHWLIDPSGNMTTYYEALLAAINAGSEPVTASYVNAGDHSQGILITADVAGTPFTCTVSGASTVHRDAVTANVVGHTLGQDYETLLALINGSSEPVTASYVNSGDHSQGVLVTADVAGVNFILYLDDDTGTLDITHVTANDPGDPLDMGVEFENLLSLVNASAEPVTASYVNAGDHSQGIKITADVAGVAFTCTLDDETGTLARNEVTANVIADPLSMAEQYEALLALVNGSAEPVTATYKNSGNHAAGIVITADVAGTAFLSVLTSGSGTLAVNNVVPNDEGNPEGMAEEYESLLALVNASLEPVTATYVNPGDHADGIILTADVAGTAFTLTLRDASGTLAAANTQPNVEANVRDLDVAFEELLALINASSSCPVAATYINDLDHSDGLTLTAKVAGTEITYVIDQEAGGTLAITNDTPNNGKQTDAIQSPWSLTSEERVIEVPDNAVSVTLYGDQDFIIDSATGVGEAQGMLVVSGVYIQLPVGKDDKLYLVSADSANVYASFSVIE